MTFEINDGNVIINGDVIGGISTKQDKSYLQINRDTYVSAEDLLDLSKILSKTIPKISCEIKINFDLYGNLPHEKTHADLKTYLEKSGYENISVGIEITDQENKP